VRGGKNIAIRKQTNTARTKPPTVTERRLIKKYGSIQAARQQEKKARAFAQQQAQAQVEQQKTRAQVDYQRMWDRAMNIYDKGYTGMYLAFVKPKGRSPQEAAEVRTVRKYLRELKKQQKAGNIRPLEGLLHTPEERAKQQANIEFFEKQKEEIKAPKPSISSPIIVGEVQPAPKKGIVERGVTGIKEYFSKTYPGTRSPITGIKEDIIPDIKKIPSITKDVLAPPVEKDRYEIRKAPPIRTFSGPLMPPTPEPEITYIGEKEISIQEQPVFGTKMVDDVAEKRKIIDIRDISVDKRRSLIRRAEEYIPGAGTAITTLGEQVYLPDAATAEKYKKLIGKKGFGAGKETTEFLREQQAQLKKDIGRYNALGLKMQSEAGLTEKEQVEMDNLFTKINTGQRGTGWQIIAEAGQQAEKEGKEVKLFGKDVSPATARGLLAFTVKAYEAEKAVLGFQIGAGIGGAALGATKSGASLLAGIGKIGKPLAYTTVPAGIGVGGTTGYQMFKETGDIPLAIGAGAGAAAGFLTPLAAEAAIARVGPKINIEKLKKSKPVGQSYVMEKDGDFYIISTSTRKGGNYFSINKVTYKLRKSGDNIVISEGKGFVDVKNLKTGKSVGSKSYDFGGKAEPLGDAKIFRSLKVGGKEIGRFEDLKNFVGKKGKVVVDTGDKVMAKNFKVLTAKQGEKTVSFADDLSKGIIRKTGEFEILRDIETGVYSQYPKYSKIKVGFKPKGLNIAEQMSREQLGLMMGRTKVDLSKLGRIKPPKIKKIKVRDRITGELKTIDKIEKPKSPVEIASDKSLDTLKGKGGSKEILDTQSKTSQLIFKEKPMKLKKPTKLKEVTGVEAMAEELVISKIKPKIKKATLISELGVADLSASVSKASTISKGIDKQREAETEIAKDVAVEEAITGSLVAPGFISKYKTPTTTTPTDYSIIKTTPTEPTTKPKAPKIPPISFGFDRKPTPQMVKSQPYNAYVLKAGPTGKKSYIKINKEPLTQESALSAMSREVDTTISARGKIEKIRATVQKVQDIAGKIRYKRKPQIALNTKDKYWKQNKGKFRTYKTKKKIALPTGVVIERQKHRLDSAREKRQITAAKRVAPKRTKKKQNKMFRL
jgi:hypothetical protein